MIAGGTGARAPGPAHVGKQPTLPPVTGASAPVSALPPVTGANAPVSATVGNQCTSTLPPVTGANAPVSATVGN